MLNSWRPDRNILQKKFSSHIRIMIDLENYIIEIVKKTGLSKTEIQDMIHEKQSKSNKVNSEKSALILVAKELCVELSLKDSIIMEKSDSIIDRVIEDLAVRLCLI